MQTQADLLGRTVEVADIAEVSALGAAQLAGPVWTSRLRPRRRRDPCRRDGRRAGAPICGGRETGPAGKRAQTRVRGLESPPGQLPDASRPSRRSGAADDQGRPHVPRAGIRQTDIASTLHISQAKVSRLLKRAAETGIVRTIVAVTPGVHTDLEQALEQRFGLLEAVVVDVEGDEPEILAGLGSAGAIYLENTLTGGERLGISSWSQTPLAVVDRLRPLRVPGAETVVQLVGGMGVPAVQTQANRLLGELAERVGASPRFAPAPLLVGRREIAENLLADPVMADVARQWQELTMALVGIGSLEPSELLQLSGNAVDPPDQRRCWPRARWVTCATGSSPPTASWSRPARSTPEWSASPPTSIARSRAASVWRGAFASAERSMRPSKEGWGERDRDRPGDRPRPARRMIADGMRPEPVEGRTSPEPVDGSAASGSGVRSRSP